MNNMFKGCVNLEIADLSGLNLEYTHCMQHYFHYCYKLKKAIFPESKNNEKKNAQNTYYLEYMFGECHDLTSIDLSSFNISSANYIYSMFYDTPNLTYIDLSSFTKKIYADSNMFDKAAENATIKIDNKTPETIRKQIPKNWTIRNAPENEE